MATRLSKRASRSRGGGAVEGWWIDAKEATGRAVGKEEWWKQGGIGGKCVSVTQYDPHGPADKPFWLFKNGDMYLGEWREGPDGCPEENGFGVDYKNFPDKCKGMVYIGDWKNGFCHGSGKSLWLESSPTWRDNCFPGSRISQNVGESRSVSRPYVYTGDYFDYAENSASATVTLKDRTTRIGPWQGGAPLGDFWGADHQAATASTLDVQGGPSEKKTASTIDVQGGPSEKKTASTQDVQGGPAEKKKRGRPRKDAKKTGLRSESNGSVATQPPPPQDDDSEKKPRGRASKNLGTRSESCVSKREQPTQDDDSEKEPRGQSPPNNPNVRSESCESEETQPGRDCREKKPRGRRANRNNTKARPESCGDDQENIPIAKRAKRTGTRSESVVPVTLQPLPEPVTSLEESNSEILGRPIATNQDRVKNISGWLAITIGFDPDLGDMETYAREFIKLGLHSVEMIVNICKAKDVAKFDWMRIFHRRQVVKALSDAEPMSDDDYVQELVGA